MQETGHEIQRKSTQLEHRSDKDLFYSGTDMVESLARKKVLYDRTTSKYDTYGDLTDTELIRIYRTGDITDKRATKRLLEERGYGHRHED